MQSNGLPPPIFKTDDDHAFFLVTLPIHPEACRKFFDREAILTADKKYHFENETHQLEPQTHQLEIQKKENLPNELKIKLENLSERPKVEEVKSIIYALCARSPLTAREIAELLKRKDKKHLVRQYLTPLVKDGLLKYVYPERGNSPNQAYAAK